MATQKKWADMSKEEWRSGVIGLIVIAVIIFAVIGAFSSGNKGTNPNAATADSTAETSQGAKTVAPTAPKSPDPIELNGQGQQATAKFKLESGLAVAKLTHTGSGHFGVWLMDSNGERVELLASETGAFDGSKAVGITSAGEYILDISADGAWTVTITQPRQSSAEATRAFSGKGQNATQLFQLGSGLARFKLTHTGSGHFGVWLMDSNGERVELLASETGAFDGSKAVGITTSGQYILDVSADGDWTIAIE